MPCEFAVEFLQFADEKVEVTFTAEAPSGNGATILEDDVELPQKVDVCTSCSRRARSSVRR